MADVLLKMEGISKRFPGVQALDNVDLEVHAGEILGLVGENGAVVIGGTSLFGGEGNILATLVGALIIATIRNGLNILGVYAFWQKVITGIIIILAVYIDQFRRRRQAG